MCKTGGSHYGLLGNYTDLHHMVNSFMRVCKSVKHDGRTCGQTDPASDARCTRQYTSHPGPDLQNISRSLHVDYIKVEKYDILSMLALKSQYLPLLQHGKFNKDPHWTSSKKYLEDLAIK